MTDLELTKLCAEAMGWKHLGAIGVPPPKRGEPDPKGIWCLSGGNDWWLNPEGHRVCGQCSSIPDPLHDDAQAMALVKRYPRECIAAMQVWMSIAANAPEFVERAIDLNRAIVECVAKMRKP